MSKKLLTLAIGASLVFGGSIAAAQVWVDSAGVAVDDANINGARGARSMSPGIAGAPGMDVGNITIVPANIRDAYSDLKGIFGSSSEIKATCSTPSISWKVDVLTSPKPDDCTFSPTGGYTCTPLEFGDRTLNWGSYANNSTHEFGSREYIRNDGAYLQAKGRGSQKALRIYSGAPASNSLAAERLNDSGSYKTITIQPPQIIITLNKSTGYSVDHQFSVTPRPIISENANLSVANGYLQRSGNVQDNLYNHLIFSSPTATYTGSTGFVSSFRNIAINYPGKSGLPALTNGKAAKFGFGSLHKGVRINSIEHVVDGGRYTDVIRIDMEAAVFVPKDDLAGGLAGNYNYIGGATEVKVPLIRFNSVGDGSCGGYGCWYDNFTYLGDKTINKSMTVTTPATRPFNVKTECTLSAI